MKILSLDEITKILPKKRKGKKVVFMSGAFDLFHYGHFVALKKAASFGNIVVIQIDGDILVKQRKGIERPILNELTRAEIIGSLDFIDYVFISNEPSETSSILDILKPHVYIRPRQANEKKADRVKREKKILKKIPYSKIVWLKQTPEISTTIILNGELKNIIKLGLAKRNRKKGKAKVSNSSKKKNQFISGDLWNIQQD